MGLVRNSETLSAGIREAESPALISRIGMFHVKHPGVGGVLVRQPLGTPGRSVRLGYRMGKLKGKFRGS